MGLFSGCEINGVGSDVVEKCSDRCRHAECFFGPEKLFSMCHEPRIPLFNMDQDRDEVEMEMREGMTLLWEPGADVVFRQSIATPVFNIITGLAFRQRQQSSPDA